VTISKTRVKIIHRLNLKKIKLEGVQF
jgi:hypothetical protein